MGRIALVLLFASACSSTLEPQEPPPPAPGDDDDEVEYCPAACERWVELGCADEEVCTRYDEPEPVCLESIPCADWCVQVVLEAPSGVVFRPQCVATVQPDGGEPNDMCDWLDLTCGE